MKIGHVLMVKDENDIIYYHLNYYKNLGFKDFYILDNGSTDGTYQLIEKFISENPQFRIHLEVDLEVTYNQHQRVNKLINLAYNEGCNWVLPVDTDELLINNQNFTNFNIYEFLNNIPEGDFIKLKWWYYRPTDNDDETEVNPFVKINHRDAEQQSSQTKILVKWKPGMYVVQGNHLLVDEHQYKEITELSYTISYAHFWQRSLQQMIKKTTNLGEAHRNIDTNRNEYMFYQSYLTEGQNLIINHFNHYKNELLQEYSQFPKESFL